MGRRFSKVFIPALFLASLLPAIAAAAELHFQSDTLFRAFQRDTASKQDATVLPAYEYLQMDVKSEEFSFHLYGWGRLDMTDKNYFAEQSAGELLYGYLEYQPASSNASLRFGRQSLFGGVSNETMDGVRIQSDLGQYFSASIYAGQPVALDSEKGRNGDSLFGGRISHHLNSLYDLGLSYKKLRNDSTDTEEVIGVDSSLNLSSGIGLNGFSSYNRETKGWGEHSYELRIPVKGIILRPYYQKFRYENYFSTGANSANPFFSLAAANEELTIWGNDLTWRLSDAWDVGGKIKTIDYALRDDAPNYYSLLANWHGEGSTAIGGELGMMAGDKAENKYWLSRAYFYVDQLERVPLSFVSGDIVYVKYDEKINSEDKAFFASLGAGKRFWEDALQVRLSADWSLNPSFDNDLRGLLTVSYTYDK